MSRRTGTDQEGLMEPPTKRPKRSTLQKDRHLNSPDPFTGQQQCERTIFLSLRGVCRSSRVRIPVMTSVNDAPSAVQSAHDILSGETCSGSQAVSTITELIKMRCDYTVAVVPLSELAISQWTNFEYVISLTCATDWRYLTAKIFNIQRKTIHIVSGASTLEAPIYGVCDSDMFTLAAAVRLGVNDWPVQKHAILPATKPGIAAVICITHITNSRRILLDSCLQLWQATISKIAGAEDIDIERIVEDLFAKSPDDVSPDTQTLEYISSLLPTRIQYYGWQDDICYMKAFFSQMLVRENKKTDICANQIQKSSQYLDDLKPALVVLQTVHANHIQELSGPLVKTLKSLREHVTSTESKVESEKTQQKLISVRIRHYEGAVEIANNLSASIEARLDLILKKIQAKIQGSQAYIQNSEAGIQDSQAEIQEDQKRLQGKLDQVQKAQQHVQETRKQVEETQKRVQEFEELASIPGARTWQTKQEQNISRQRAGPFLVHNHLPSVTDVTVLIDSDDDTVVVPSAVTMAAVASARRSGCSARRNGPTRTSTMEA